MGHDFDIRGSQLKPSLQISDLAPGNVLPQPLVLCNFCRISDLEGSKFSRPVQIRHLDDLVRAEVVDCIPLFIFKGHTTLCQFCMGLELEDLEPCWPQFGNID